MAPAAMIEADGISKRYGDLVALNQVSFTIQRGEIVGFLGPNGAGKTTTMRILTCFFPPSAGSARVAGFDVFSQSLEVRKRLGYLPEGVPLYGEMPVGAYLAFVARMKGVAAGDRAREIRSVMDACDIADVQHRLIRNLSKGYRQRVGLAQALLGNPEVLILDEPTAGLDPRQIIEIRNVITSLAGERTIILSTHILPEVEMTCHRVLVMNKGSIVADAPPAVLSKRLQETTRIRVVVGGPREEVARTLLTVEGVTDVAAEDDGAVCRYAISVYSDRDVRADIARVVVNSGWDLIQLHEEGLSLEDVFVKLISERRPVGEPT